MLKLFRMYNKYLLVVLGSLLMVVFLIEGTISGLMPSAEDQVIGRINGEKIRMRDQRNANIELDVIARALPVLSVLTPREPVQWMLMVEGAKQAGLNASNEQVAQLLSQSSATGTTANDIAKQLGVPAEVLIDALRHWLMVQQYVELTTGQAHLPLEERINTIFQAVQYMQMNMGNAQMLLDPARGKPRISKALLERFLQDQQATVTVQAVAIDAARELPHVATPSDETILALYNEYKDAFAGEGKGYGLGYKLPDRVKLEYLTVPIANARNAVSIEEKQILAYYDENTAQFIPQTPAGTTQPATPPAPRPYLEVRNEIRSQLIDDEAYKLATRVASAAQTALIDNARLLPEEGGYRKIIETWTPLSFSDLAKQLEERFGVRVEARRIQDRWLTLNEIQTLPGLGSSYILVGQQPLPAAVYVSGARELNPRENHPASTLHLQAYMPSQPLQGTDGSFHLFRLTDVQAEHTPKLEDIRGQVLHDAQRIEAYKRLLTQLDSFKAKSDQPLAAIASEYNTTIIGPTSFNRRDTLGGMTAVPQVAGIGRSEAFVDQVFELALAEQSQDATQPVKPAEAGPAGVVAADDKLTVYIVRVLDFQPMSKRDFDQYVSLPFARTWLNLAMTAGLEEDPFSTDNLAKRVGFKWENPARDGAQQDTAHNHDSHAGHNH